MYDRTRNAPRSDGLAAQSVAEGALPVPLVEAGGVSKDEDVDAVIKQPGVASTSGLGLTITIRYGALTLLAGKHPGLPYLTIQGTDYMRCILRGFLTTSTRG